MLTTTHLILDEVHMQFDKPWGAVFCICMLSAGAACVCSLDVTPLIGSHFACMAGLQEKDVHGNAKFR